MLQTKKINNDVVAVAFEPTEIMVRNSGKKYFNTEKPLAVLKNGKLIVNSNVAKDFGIEIVMKEGVY